MGTLDAMGAKTPEGSSGHHVAFRSPQQLRAFNAPFQLGRAPDSLPGEPDKRFETPHDAAYVRVPIQADDIIVLATDGASAPLSCTRIRALTHRRTPDRARSSLLRAHLVSAVDARHVACAIVVPISISISISIYMSMPHVHVHVSCVSVCHVWLGVGFWSGDGLAALAGLYDNLTEEEVLTVIAENEEATEEDLAHLLAERAREMSLRHDIDSPFAVLAKDNDILWGGGRPDDTTVIVSRIVDRISYADGQTPPTITGPGPPPPETVEAEPTARGLDFDTSWG